MNTETQNYESERKILDSGSRRQFDSGAVRDDNGNKGRCDLLPLDIIAEYVGGNMARNAATKNNIVSNILNLIGEFLYDGQKEGIYVAIQEFVSERYQKTSDAILELSKHYQEGAKKYAERNWEKGIPAHCYVDSGVRHLIKWADNWNDEPHDRAFLWNMFGLLWTIKHHPALNDLPYATTQLTESEENYIRKDIQVTKEVYNRLVDNNYDNPMQAVDDVNELVEALEKGSEING